MKIRINTLLQRSDRCILHLGLITSVAAVTLLAVSGTAANAFGQELSSHEHASSAKLVQAVREATRQFIDVNAATAAGYEPLFGCVTGPDHGAMGVHYIKLALVTGGEIDVTQPQALIYEPWEGGMRFVGVEFITDYATWLKNHDGPPVLEGQLFQLIASPNRYGLSSLFELHVWAWRDNPNGAFVDWNNRVTCEHR